MGGDGGVFAVNRKFFAACRNTSKDGQTEATENEERQIKLSKRYVKCRTCAISSEELIEPIVTCQLGYLYNKEHVITALLDKTLHENFSHIKGLKCVKEVKLTGNTDSNRGGGDDSGSGGKEDCDVACPYMCPVTQLPFNGVYGFVAIWTTGYVLSEKALREIGMEGLQLEYGPFTEADVVGLLPMEEELNSRRAALQAKEEIALKARLEKKRARSKVKAIESGKGQKDGEVLGDEDCKEGGKAAAEGQIKAKKAKVKASGAVLNSGSSVVAAAQSSVAASKGKSAVYDHLFHKDEKNGGEKLSGRDLFMSVAGIRYTL
jgi:hypothetical protein